MEMELLCRCRSEIANPSGYPMGIKKNTILIFACSLGVTLLAIPNVAGVEPIERIAERMADGVHPDMAGINEGCSIAYYNLCSGWIWLWAMGGYEDEAGVVFDLVADCGKAPGDLCTNIGFWWYWRYTAPGYCFTITYSLFEVDSEYCKVGSAIGILPNQDPVERWNYYPGLGSTVSDLVSITGSLDCGTLPMTVTDATARNDAAGCNPPPLIHHSVYYGGYETKYCPPHYFADDVGYVNILMDASFSCGTTSTERTSWTSIKSLFR